MANANKDKKRSSSSKTSSASKDSDQGINLTAASTIVASTKVVTHGEDTLITTSHLNAVSATPRLGLVLMLGLTFIRPRTCSLNSLKCHFGIVPWLCWWI